MIHTIRNQGSGAIGSSTYSKVHKKTAKNAITDGFTQQIQTLAREDAEKGIYMDDEFSQLRRARMEQYVSPDRAGPMAQVTSVMNDLSKEQERVTAVLERLLGNCSAKVTTDALSQTAEIYSPNGEPIASYNSFGGGWTVRQTKAELHFISETDMIYLKAFREARAEMNGNAQGTPGAGAVDVVV